MILVTGGTGFLGSTLIKLLIDEGLAVLATKRPTSSIPESLKASSLVQWIDADITDYFALADTFEGVTQVYHCAAKISYQKSDWASMLHTNITGTQHIVNLCLEHGARLVHVSSIASLGESKNGQLIDEMSKWDDGSKNSRYAISKYESEMIVWRGIVEGLNAVIVDPSVIMGVGTGKKSAGVIFNMVKKGLKIYPPGTVGIVDVIDVAKLMTILMKDDSISGERYILNSQNFTNKELLERVALALEKPAPTIAAKPFMLSIGWRVAKLVAMITGSKASLTREAAQASSANLAYTNRKITDGTGYTFKPVDVTLQEMSKEYKT